MTQTTFQYVQLTEGLFINELLQRVSWHLHSSMSRCWVSKTLITLNYLHLSCIKVIESDDFIDNLRRSYTKVSQMDKHVLFSELYYFISWKLKVYNQNVICEKIWYKYQKGIIFIYILFNSHANIPQRVSVLCLPAHSWVFKLHRPRQNKDFPFFYILS